MYIHGSAKSGYKFAGSKSIGLQNTPCTEMSLGSADLTALGIGTKANSTLLAEVKAHYSGLAHQWAARFGLDPYLILAMICQESGGRETAGEEPGKTAYGLMQWENSNDTNITCEYVDGTKKTINNVKDYIRTTGPDRASRQIEVGCAELRNRLNATPNLLVALQGYNFGPGGIKRCITYYISGGQNTGDTYCGISNERYNEYVKSRDNGWLSAREWYHTVGHQKFPHAGGGDEVYLEHILRYYDVNASAQEGYGSPWYIDYSTNAKIQL